MSYIPGRVHEHPINGVLTRVYHRADGALMIHGRRHSKYSPQKDRQHHTNKHPGKAGYPHAGDGVPVHTGKNRPLKMRGKRTKSKKGRRGKR